LLRSAALGGLAVGSAAILVACLTGGWLAEWMFILSTVALPLFLILLGAAAGPRRVARLAGLGVLTLVLLSSNIGLGLLSRAPAEPWVLGLPLSAWLMLVGLVVVPLGLVGWLYAATFEDPDPGSLRDSIGSQHGVQSGSGPRRSSSS
jgi:hypothetical protein